ncbi:fatty acid desaturase family protein [Chengkuizengella marina]|uniref:Fatty acid desaturase n=1 Tax=Chengkuizengella marina TaxID=2507566 RepID=A0A6N9Q953_9BACL|nr:fatty acid desaturase family protein [Chengkuizengella marina]NBI31163.1 fatty acid desaturase [Chengkuizengella marina]
MHKNVLAHDPKEDYIDRYRISKEVQKKLNLLYTKNNWYNFFSIGLDWGIILGSVLLWLNVPTWWMYIISIVLIGSRMRGLDNIMHEASHAMLFKNQLLNKWMACIFAAFPIFTSYTTYCKSHFLHHKYLWTDKDPDYHRYKLIGLDDPPKDGFTFFLKHILKPVLLVHVPKYILGTVSANLYSKGEPSNERVARILYWLLIITNSIIFGFWDLILLFWIVPLFTTFQIIRYWVEISEHGGLKNSNGLYASRNSFGNLIESFLLHPHNDPYHLVHHLCPAIPHYNVKKAHLILMEDIEYRNAHHCFGFFVPKVPGFSTVVEDIRGKNYTN